jgi:hypothetical protein
MTVVSLLLVLALLGLVAWAVTSYIPMPEGMKKLIIVAVVVIGVLYVLHAFGLGLPNMRVPTVK